MAKIKVLADTTTGELSCTVDGKGIENLTAVSCYRYNAKLTEEDKDAFVVNFNAESRNMKNGVKTSTYAQDLSQETAKIELSSGNAKFISEDKQIVEFIKSSSIIDSVRKWLRK